MKHLESVQDSVAAAAASTSVVGAIAAKATELQPIISAFSGLIAIVTGMFAIWYYIKKINRIDGQTNSNPKDKQG
jgi:ABC-type nickel/cobalt efflux system permease component RcnA